jgi:hypothetical protein
MLAIVVIEGFALVLLGLLVVGLLRSHAEILRALHDMGAAVDPAFAADGPDHARGPDPQEPESAPVTGATGASGHDLHGQTLGGEAIGLGLAGSESDTLLAFLSATCHDCEPFWTAFADGVVVPNDARLVVVVQDGDNHAALRRLAGPELLVVSSDDAWADYDVPGSPHFVYVDGPSGQVTGEGTAGSWPQVRDLLEQATAARHRAGAQPIDLVAGGRDNAERIDRELQAAGIGPGHPSLYPDRDGPDGARTD